MVRIDTPFYSIEYILNGMEALRLIESCGRTSYKSDSKLVNEYDRVKNIPELIPFLQKITKIIKDLYDKNGRNYVEDRYTKFSSVINKDLEMVKDASALQFVKMIIENGHLSVLEFSFLVVRFYVNIGYTREQNRHRMTSIIERSTRYCNFSEDRFENSVHFIKPIWYDPDITKAYPKVIDGEMEIWESNMKQSESFYLETVNRLTQRAKEFIKDTKDQAEFIRQIPQMARGVLPLDTVSEECIGANLREWADVILFERASPKAHPSMQQIMYQLKKDLQKLIPVVFDYTKKVVRTFN